MTATKNKHSCLAKGYMVREGGLHTGPNCRFLKGEVGEVYVLLLDCMCASVCVDVNLYGAQGRTRVHSHGGKSGCCLVI